jgi:hypothetical protein
MATQPEQLKARTKQFAIRILRDLLTEANELLAIFAASLWTARQERKTQSVNVSMTR